mmetsp:Transcript_4599/g.5315  ORF Transcript_4599/g.5315 Transcript_4599/m.5315 type:complete len:112 (+) Transcript_4599:44-379(+)
MWKAFRLFYLFCFVDINAWINTPPKSLSVLKVPPASRLFDSNNSEDDDGWGEIANLQKEIQSSKSTQTKKEPERDLFIPIFALVSLAGLFGSYGYEMLRLYSRGELYLPWE